MKTQTDALIPPSDGLLESLQPTADRGAPKGFIRKYQAAEIMGMTVRSVDNYMKQKLIPYYKFGKSVYFKESELLAAVEKCRVA